MSDKSIPFKGITGASYQSLSKYSAVERSVNWFPETVENPDETKTRIVLYPTPCTGFYGELPDPSFQQNARGLIEINGSLYGVNGTVVFRFYAPNSGPSQPNPNGTFVAIGTVVDDGTPVTMIANGVIASGQQILISSANRLYVIITATDTLSPVTALAGQSVAFLDDYFISIIPGTNGIQVSDINDGTTWNPLATAYTQGQSDALVNLIADREYLWLFGSRRMEIWYNAGTLAFPFAIQPGAFIEMGLGAQNSLTQADNSLFWLGQDKRGGLSAWRANGLTPVRISNHAVEQFWAKYSSISDCITYSFLWRGHTFIRFIFPTATVVGNPQVGYGWTYDVTTSTMLGYSVWHENRFTNNQGQNFAPIERTHAYFQGTHVVGSGGVDGNIGTLFQFTDITALPTNPVITLQCSDDGGQTWGIERILPVGVVGQYTYRALWNLLGSSRDRVFKIKAVDYGDASQVFPIVRERICPHIWDNNNRIFYSRLELELAKGIGNEGGISEGFWAIITGELTIDPGVN